jgi:Lytic polysaccharide mono-oxygenase, cellulose-degrading
MKRSLSLVGGVLAGSLLFAAGTAHAHIKMLKPPSWLKDDATGGATEKGGPCGPGGYDALFNSSTPSNVVTTFQAGEEVTVEWAETIDHPGYFRIALAENRADLKDPTVPFTDMGNCNVDHSKIPTGAHDNVLADGILIASSATMRPGHPNYSFKVKLPNKPCEKCTLQLIQFMESHPPDCIYYHCADIKIVGGAAGGDAGVSGDAGTAADAGTSGAADASTTRDSSITMGATPGGTTSGTGAATPGGGTTTVTSPATGGTAGGSTTGGTATATGTAGGTGTVPPAGTGGVAPAAAEDDGGCSVSLGRDVHASQAAFLVGLLAFVLFNRRRKLARR